MGGLESNVGNFKWIDKYELIDIDNNDRLMKIMSRVGESEYIGKQYPCYGEEIIKKMEANIDKKVLSPCQYMMKLVKVGIKNETVNCNQTKIFCLIFEKPLKTLKEESIQRKLNAEKFSVDDILCILESCVRALTYLKEMEEYHTKISASNIYINEDNTIILGDPWIMCEVNDFNGNLQGNIYPSPEKILHKNGYIGEPDLFLSDLFSLGVTLLEMYFLEHMDVIYERGYKRICETKMIEKINKIESRELKKKMKILLSQEPLKRYEILKEYSLVNSKAETFIKSEKQQFKKQYIKNMLVTSEVKTVKLSRSDYSVRQKTIRNNTSRNPSDFSSDTITQHKRCRLVEPEQKKYAFKKKQHNQKIHLYSKPQEKPANMSKRNLVFEEIDDKSISSIAKNESELSRDFQLDLFDTDKKYIDHCKMKNDKKNQFLRKSNNLLREQLNADIVNSTMNQDKKVFPTPNSVQRGSNVKEYSK